MRIEYECGCFLDFEIGPNLVDQHFRNEHMCDTHHNKALEIAYNNRVGKEMRELESLKLDYEGRKK